MCFYKDKFLRLTDDGIWCCVDNGPPAPLHVLGLDAYECLQNSIKIFGFGTDIE